MGLPRNSTVNRIIPAAYDYSFTVQEDGLVPSPGEVQDYFLRDDGTWQPAGDGNGGADTPSGTGFVHITGDVQDDEAKLVENADVDDAAGIEESKLDLNFATHSNANDPTAGQKAALVGTNGTPGAGNPYFTDSDPRLVSGSVTLAQVAARVAVSI